MRDSPCGRAFVQGYVCAVANIIRTHGEGVIAKDVLAGCKPSDWSMVDRDDYDVLEKAGLAPRGKRQKARRASPTPAEPR